MIETQWEPGDRVYSVSTEHLTGTVIATVPGMVRVHWDDHAGHTDLCTWYAPTELDWYTLPAPGKIIVIGLSPPSDDQFTLFKIAEWLERHRPKLHAHLRILSRDVDLDDMTTRPEKGDGLDAIGADTKLVIAMHLFGIDKIPGGNTAIATSLDPKRCYNRDNLQLLQLCMKRRAPLISVGDQPWLGLETRTLMYDPPLIYLYENKAAAA